MEQQITPEVAITEYKTILAKSEITPTIDVTELATLAARASAIVVTDITNEAQMTIAKNMRKELSDARIEISKNAKTARDVFTKINRGISAVENVLLGEFESEEERLKGYETQLKAKRLRDERMLVLPIRKERLAAINVTENDEILLAMDDLSFSNYLANKQTEILNEQKRKAEEEARIKEAENRAKAEAEAEAKRQADEVERKHREELARLEAEKQAKINAELKAKAEAEAEAKRLSKAKAYQQFLKDNNYDDTTCLTVDNGLTVTFYRQVAVYTK